MEKYKNLIGQKFGRLTIIEIRYELHAGHMREMYLCQCECGTVKLMRADGIKAGRSVSCGCYGREMRLKATNKHVLSNCSQLHHPLYDVWCGIIQRCCNPNNKEYKNYGGREITVCDKWRNNFQVFYDWAMAHGYRRGLQIDRIDVNRGYSPENCRWTTPFVQSRNKRNNVYVKFMGEMVTLQDVSNHTGISRSTLYYRYKHGYPLLKACEN